MAKKEQEKNNKKEKKTEVKPDPKTIEGLQQVIVLANGEAKPLYELINESDWWQSNGKIKRTMLTHDAVKKLADMAGIKKYVTYMVLTQPDAYNNYQYTINATIETANGEKVAEIGEANRNNLGAKGRNNPANMAQKRAYDRAVLRALGITGLLSEEELSDEENEDKMEGLTHDERKQISPIINQLLLVKDKKQLIVFSAKMKQTVKESKFTPAQLDYLRKLYKKTLADLSKVNF